MHGNMYVDIYNPLHIFRPHFFLIQKNTNKQTNSLISSSCCVVPNMLTARLTPQLHRRFPGDTRISGGISGRRNNAKTTRKMVYKHGLTVINSSSGDMTVESSNAPFVIEKKQDDSINLKNESLLGSSSTQVRAVLTIKKKIKERVVDKVYDQWFNFMISVGQGILLQLVSLDIDPDTNSGRTVEAYVKDWPINSTSTEYLHIDEYAAEFTVPSNFGNPGAILVTNSHSREFYLVEIVLQGLQDGPVFFPANSWIHSRNDNPESRIIFRNHTYLPSQTPPGIKDLRREDMLSLRGTGKGERKLHERVYDYAPYNDLGKPDRDADSARPVLAGSEFPYPRRCRTGRPPTKNDPLSERRLEKPHQVYVPRDETFEELKQATFSAGKLKALLHNVVPLINATISSDIPFGCFSEIDSLYLTGLALNNDDQTDKTKYYLGKFTKELFNIKDQMVKYQMPAVIRSDRFSWLRDNEFARQALAGVNPVNINLMTEFPIVSELDPAIYGPPESAITKEILEEEMSGMTVEEAIKNKKLFIIDYHDLFLPFVNKINELPGSKTYAPRAIFFYTKDGTLQPIVIELSIPPTQSSPPFKRAYTHGNDATSHWLWKLAKGHFCAVDAGVHQLVNHWLRTHASMEAYIIATHRQLSQIHPIYKLLHPHLRYTMEINALARQSLINGGGNIECNFTPGKYSMDISSAAYKKMWRFDMEALPADLLRRGMAVEDPSEPFGIKLVIEDYPYAADALLVWSAIKDWVGSYVAYFYPDPNAVAGDVELQEWWKEIRNKGHADKKNEPWWPKLDTKDDLTDILTIIIWAGSGEHAAINFGQYPFGGFVPNRPTILRSLIPQENEPEFEKFLKNPQATFLASMPTRLQCGKIMAVQETLSTHSPDEEYLGQEYSLFSHWIDDQEVKGIFERFSSRLKEVEEIIHQRNNNLKLRNRTGAGVPPYELLLPTSGPGVTGRGIPNSISI